MSYYPRSPEEIIDHEAARLSAALGDELYWWLETLTDYHEPELSDKGWELVMSGVLG